MKKNRRSFVSILVLLSIFTILLVSCGTAATQSPERIVEYVEAPPANQPVVEKEVAVVKEAESPPAADQASEAAQAGKEVYTSASNTVNRPNRLIIKDGQLILVVTDTDVAIDRITQIVSDLGGYIISSRSWFQNYAASTVDQKFATLTLGVPVDSFENALLRLRQIAVKVKDEQASGQDVSDEYVDLQSRLKNLEATRDRIKTFLETAATVEEALKVNEQLSGVEAEIEQVRGRMNYLFDRASYSTLTVQIEPEPPVLTPTPSPTITPTPTPTSTPTPAVWNPGRTWTSATRSMRSIWRDVGDMLIWFFTIVLPCLLPFILIGLGIWYYRRWRRNRGKGAGSPGINTPDISNTPAQQPAVEKPNDHHPEGGD